MHYPLLASLIATLSLISVACAMPVSVSCLRCFHQTHDICLTSARSRQRNRGAPLLYLFILDQDNPFESISTDWPIYEKGLSWSVLHGAQKVDTMPKAVKDFFSGNNIMAGLSYGMALYRKDPDFVLQSLDLTYTTIMEKRLAHKLPIYFRVLTPPKHESGCHSSQFSCLAIICEDSLGYLYGAIIETNTGKLIAQSGDSTYLAKGFFFNSDFSTMGSPY